MPLPREVLEDQKRRGQALSLRMLPLHQLLSYAQSDRGERVFEMSLAAEAVVSLLGTAHANLISDVLLLSLAHKAQQTQSASFLADARVATTFHYLRSRSSAPAPAHASNACATSEEDKTQHAQQVLGNACTEEENVQVSTADVDGIEAEPSPQQQESARGEEQTKAAEAEAAAEAAETESAEAEAEAEAAVKELREQFVAACRWFDAGQKRCLHASQLLMILNCSTRNVSRADAEDAVDAAVRAVAGAGAGEEPNRDTGTGEGDRLRYETFL